MKKGDLRKQEILATAEALFCARGYEKTSIQDIIDRLKSSKGSFYHHFASKESLLEGICIKRANEIYLEASKSVFPDSPPVESLNFLLSGMIPFHNEKLSFLLMILPTFTLPEGKMVRITYCEALTKQFAEPVISCLIRGHETGQLACTDPGHTSDLILTIVNRLWTSVSDIILCAEENDTEADISEILTLTECCRNSVERMLSLTYGSLVLLDIPSIQHTCRQIHNHWSQLNQ